MIKKLTKKDIGRWVIYNPKQEKGRIKSFHNEGKTAFVVYHADNNLWTKDLWKNYTAQATNYSDLKFN